MSFQNCSSLKQNLLELLFFQLIVKLVVVRAVMESSNLEQMALARSSCFIAGTMARNFDLVMEAACFNSRAHSTYYTSQLHMDLGLINQIPRRMFEAFELVRNC
jgi:hypothetical protein